MELGAYGFPQRLYIKSNDIRINFGSAPTTPNFGLVSVGDGAWDGLSTGFFVGSSSGTLFAGNALSTFLGNLIDLQIGGTSFFEVDKSGNATMATFPAVLNTPAGAISPAAIDRTPTMATLSGNVTMTSRNTFYDGPTISVPANSHWFIVAGCTVLAASTAGKLTGKLWDGTTSVITSGEVVQVSASNSTLVLAGITTSTGSNRTFKMSVTATVNSNTLLATCSHNGPTNTASWILGFEVN